MIWRIFFSVRENLLFFHTVEWECSYPNSTGMQKFCEINFANFVVSSNGESFFFKLLFILLAFWQKLVISNTCTSFEKVRQSKYQRIYAVSWFHENFEVVFKYLTNRFSHCVRFFYYYKRQIPVEETDEVSFCTIWELVRGHYWLFYKFVRNIVKLTVCFSSNHFIYLVYFVMFAQIGTFSFDSFRATSLLWLTIVSSAIRRPTPFKVEN